MTEKSVLDYIIVSKGLQNSLIEMKIDENKEYVLARYFKKQNQELKLSTVTTTFCPASSLLFTTKQQKG